MVTCTGLIGIHEGADKRTYVRTDVHDIMAIKPNFLTSMGYHIFLTMLDSKGEIQVSISKSVFTLVVIYVCIGIDVPENRAEL